MRQLSLIVLTMLVLACAPDSESVGHSGSGGSGSGSVGDSGDAGTGSTADGSASDSDLPPETSDSASSQGASTNSGGSSSGPAAESSGTSDCEESDCGACPDGTVLEQYCEADTWVCDCVETANTCDLPAHVEEAATGKTFPQDCGTVSVTDTDEAYVAAHDCVIAASEDQQAYRMLAEMDEPDATRWIGVAGAVGFVYSESLFIHNIEGDSGQETIWRLDCNIRSVAGCTPSASDGPCLTCSGKTNQVCFVPGE